MKRLFTLFTLFTCLCYPVVAWEYLEIIDVDWWWSTGSGNIESASCLVEPKGFYAECTLILEFGAVEGWYHDEASLEVDMNFKLPVNSSIKDLYLWIDGVPEKGAIYDKWTASLIYESIVQRRIDPAILTVVSGNEYNLKVFPLPVMSSRKVLIRYLTPIGNALNGNPLVQIPLNIPKLSYELPAKFKIAFKGGDSNLFPKIREASQIDFSLDNDADFGACWVANIGNLKNYSSLSLSYVQNGSENLRLSTFSDSKSGNKYYQLALNHIDLFEVDQRRKAIYLVDFIDANSSQYNKQHILDELELSIINSYSEKDSFNILFSGLSTTFVSDYWVSGHTDSVRALFDKLTTGVFNDYSNLPNLLNDGIDFILNNGNAGAIVLISSSNSNGTNTEANALISDFMELMGSNTIPVHIVDLDDQYYGYNDRHIIGGQYFSGNEYFYSRLSQMTVGEYHTIRNTSLPVMMEKVNHRTAGYFKSLEVFVQTQNGYAFSNYRLNTAKGLIYNDEVFCIIGQFIGEPPFEVSVYGQNSSNQVYFASDTVYAENIIQSDSVLKTIWSINKIRELFGLEQNNQVINQIIKTSISERILCDYTAFLVLEPDFEIPEEFEDEIEIWEEDEFWTVAVDDLTDNKDFTLTNFPNPFSDKTTITYSVPEDAEVSISIFNSIGQLVRVVIDENHSAGEYAVELLANDLEEGIYQCLLNVNGKVVKRIKLVVL